MPSALKRRMAMRTVKVAAASYDRLRPPGNGVVVLLYHRVGATTGVEVDLPGPMFARQMEVLAESERVVPLDRAVASLTGNEPPDFEPVVVTFDDGTADFADAAVPVLARFGIPATLYLATDFVERGRPFPAGGAPLSWSAIRDVVSTGLITIGSHTHTHLVLDRSDAGATVEELDRSRELIEDRVGVTADHFAYPKAILGSPAAEAAVRQRFCSAAVAGTRPNAYGRTDVHRLCRSPVQVADGIRWFSRKLQGGMALEDTMRRTLNRRRHRGVTT